MNRACPDLEQVFVELAEGHGPALEHARGCEHCRALLHQHEQLEQSLFQLEDPFPPHDFVQQVMAKVEATPVPVRREVWTGLAIMASALTLGVASLVISGNVGLFGVAAAATLMDLKVLLFGLGDGVAAAWQTAALPLLALVFAFMLFGLFGLKRVTGGAHFADVKLRAIL